MAKRNSREALRLLETHEYYKPGGKNKIKNALPNHLRGGKRYPPFNIGINNIVNRLGNNTRAYATLHHFISQNIPEQNKRERERTMLIGAKVGSRLANLSRIVSKRREISGLSSSKRLVSTTQLRRRLGTIQAKRNYNKEVKEMLKKYSKNKSPSPVRRRRVSI
jgi:hypothetical protein